MEILDTASSPENGVHFTDAELLPVQTALKTKLFKRTEDSQEAREAKFQVMYTALSEVFGIPEVKISTVQMPARCSGLAQFRPESNIVLTEKYLSLVTVLSGFARALAYHKPELAPRYNEETGERVSAGLTPSNFSLSMFKEAAPEMFEAAKNNGRLGHTSVPYTDNGRLSSRTGEPIEHGEDTPEGATTDLPTPPAPGAQTQTPPAPQPPAQRPDVDPENRSDRGNGLGED